MWTAAQSRWQDIAPNQGRGASRHRRGVLTVLEGANVPISGLAVHVGFCTFADF